MRRIPWTWTDPLSSQKHKLWVTKDFVGLLKEEIEEEEQAENFFAAYEEVCPNAEFNIGYMFHLISDPDIREDAADLFMIDIQIKSYQLFGPSDPPYGSSLGVIVIDGKRWSAEGLIDVEPTIPKVKKAIKKKVKR